jgi:hypothetical protein
MYGSEANGMFQYPDKVYNGFNKHSKTNQCADCHDAHKLEVSPETCVECHEDVVTEEDIFNIKDEQIDYDGDGDAAEGLFYEEQGMLEALAAAIQVYSKDVAGSPVAYNPAAHPYFFIDTNENGVADPEESVSDNRYASWTPRMLEAAYNFQWASKDPGSFVHNGAYVLQALFDSLEDIGADVSAMTRPEAEAE